MITEEAARRVDLSLTSAMQIFGIDALNRIMDAFNERWSQVLLNTGVITEQQVVATLYGPIEMMGERRYIAMIGRPGENGEIDPDENVYAWYLTEVERKRLII